MTVKTLFLDFDGVLHPTLAEPDQRLTLAPQLAKVIGAFECDIVISSSWRFQLEINEIVQMLPMEIASRIVDTTGKAVIGRHSRYREIFSWLKSRGDRDWRALDDSAFEFPTTCPQLIRCDGARGISSLELNVLGRWLEGAHK